MHAFNWVEDDSELIDFDNSSFNENKFDIFDSCKIYRNNDDVKIEYLNGDNLSKENNSSENDNILKLGEIKHKKNKFYFIPNVQEELEDLNGDKIFSWLIFKGDKYPKTKNKYKIKVGDIFKLARIYFIVRGIHIHQKNLEKKDTNILISYHSNINQSINFKGNYNDENKLDDNSNSSDTDIYEESEDDDENNKDKKSKNILKLRRKRSDKELIDSLKSEKIINIKPKISNNHLKTSIPKKSEKMCRICYMGEIDNFFNPLIKPCKCSGSMKYIHYKCLLHWMKTKIQIDKTEYLENNYFSLYSPENIECELCKQYFPHFIKHNNKLFNLTELEQNYDNDLKENNNGNENYIVLDSMSPDKDILPYRYIVQFDENKKIKIGRGLDANLVLNDLSISRNHCQLELNDNGDIYLKDNNSKFGTLILVQAKALEIFKGQVLTVQTGRTYLDIYYEKNFELFGCCKAEEIDLKSTYEKINNKSIKIDKNSVVLTESESEENNNDDNNKDDEDRKEDNEYENNIKIINNKKIKMVKISKKDKKKSFITDLDSNDVKKEKSKSKKKLINLNNKEDKTIDNQNQNIAIK